MRPAFSVLGVRHGHIVEAARKFRALGWECVLVADDDPSLAHPLASELGAPFLHSPPLDALSSHPAPLVLSADVNARKPLLVRAALESGSHVLVDKPLAISSRDVLAIQEASGKHSKGVWVLFTLRYNGMVRALERLVREGRLGDIACVEAARPHRLNPASRPDWMFEPAAYGGVLNDLACHDIDLYLWLTGAVPEWVKAEEKTVRFTSLERGAITDFGLAVFWGENAPAGTFRADWLTPDAFPGHGDCRLRVIGTKGYAELFYAGDPAAPGDPRLVFFSDSEPPVSLPPETVEAGLETELAAHLSSGRPMTLSSRECLLASALSALAGESATSGNALQVPPEIL